MSLDLEGNGSRSTVVAGIRTSKIPNTGLKDLTGFVKIYGGGAMPRVDWEFPGHCMSGLRIVKFENGSRRQTMATFADAGSTFGFSLNVFVFATENGPGSVTLPSVEGGLAARDLDGDGREEVIFQSCFEPSRISPRILWRDVLRWNGFGFVKANERFGAFYRDQIENYYRVNIRKAEDLRHPESYIAGNRRAIERAREVGVDRVTRPKGACPGSFQWIVRVG